MAYADSFFSSVMQEEAKARDRRSCFRGCGEGQGEKKAGGIGKFEDVSADYCSLARRKN